MDYFLELAESYLEWGISVIPLRPRKKRPDAEVLKATTGNYGWKAFQKKRANREHLHQWFRLRQCNVGVVTGAISGNLIILDFDFDADKIFKKFLKQLNYPKWPISKTSKGYHLWLRCQYNAIGDNRILAWAKNGERYIETRANGGYVVAPPSIHPKGMDYFFVNNLSVGIPVLSLPEFARVIAVAESFSKKKKPNKRKKLAGEDLVATPEGHLAKPVENKTTYINGTLKSIIEGISTAVPGTRSSEFFKYSCQMGSLVAGGHIEYEKALRVLMVAAQKCGILYDDGEYECERQARNGMKAGAVTPLFVQEKNPLDEFNV